MDIYKGTVAFSGIAIGKILYYHKSEYQIRQYEITDIKAEMEFSVSPVQKSLTS